MLATFGHSHVFWGVSVETNEKSMRLLDDGALMVPDVELIALDADFSRF